MIDTSKNKASLTFQDYVEKFNELSTVFDAMPTGVFAILDPKLNIATINKAASAILGADSENLIGKDAHQIFESHFPGILKLIEETIQNRRPVKNFTLEIENSNAEFKTFLVSTALTEGIDTQEFGVVLVFHDISEITRLRKTAMSLQSFGALIGASPPMKDVYSLIETVAQYDTTVLIYGETGTGKELVARTIHEYSSRATGPFVPVSCSALSSTLLESELFGHVKGAFTGAIKDRQGRFEIANGGTIFLDEIGTVTLDVQVKLLRTIQERLIERVGSSESIPVDVRIISATNRVLPELVAKDEFREDLYYRLKVFQINVPPLRERRLDIPILAEHFIDKFNKLHNRNIIGLTPAAKELLMNYFWPGNVREFGNAIEHALILSPGKVIEYQSLPPEIRHAKVNGTPLPPPTEDLNDIEEKIRRTLASFSGNVSRAAESLGMHRTTLWRKMREFGIKR
jgi:two-component system response regulator HydG